MGKIQYAAYRTALEVLHFSGVAGALSVKAAGVGAILTLHHVRPPRRDAFQPNITLEVTPEFLEQVIEHLRRRGFDLVSVEEAHRRLVTHQHGRPFIALTFDDGYRDNLEFAVPILRKHEVPYTVYVASSFPDGDGELWWEALERLIGREKRIEFDVDGRRHTVECADADRKYAAFGEVARELPGAEHGLERQPVLHSLAERYGLDLRALCSELCMDWRELRELTADPLCTIGAHTVNHVFLGTVDKKTARAEISGSADAIERSLGSRPAHFAYPYGTAAAAGKREFGLAAEAGFKTAVTTRPNILVPHDRARLTALSRISLNGRFQALRYLDVLLSGVPFLPGNLRRHWME